MLSEKKIASILQFLDCDRAFLNELISIYTKELTEGLNRLAEKPIEQKTIQYLTHKLSGTASLLQLNTLTANLKQTEALAHQENCTPSHLKQTIELLTSTLTALKKTI